MNKSINKILPIVALLCFTVLGTVKAQQKLVFKDEFEKEKPGKQWIDANGTWSSTHHLPEGSNIPNWAILLCKKELPEEYILTFYVLVDSSTGVFKVMLNLYEESFLAIQLYQRDNEISVEERHLYFSDISSYSGQRKRKKVIEKETHIWPTMQDIFLPKVNHESKHVRQHWKIQKTNNEIYLWIDDEPIVSSANISEIARNGKGKFGFATNGKVKIDNVKLFKTQKDASLPPTDFQGRERIIPIFIFSE